MWTLFILQLLTHLITFSSLLFFSSHFFCANFAKILRHTFIIFMSHTLPKCVHDFLVHACTHIAIIGFHVVHNKNFLLLHLTLPFYTLHNHLREALLWIIFFLFKGARTSVTADIHSHIEHETSIFALTQLMLKLNYLIYRPEKTYFPHINFHFSQLFFTATTRIMKKICEDWQTRVEIYVKRLKAEPIMNDFLCVSHSVLRERMLAFERWE